ncbi:MAG: inositol monophosphatase family protein, partial [Nanoarchaeota archaeon]
MDIFLARQLAKDAARDAGQILIQNLRKSKRTTFKAKSDITTNVDLLSEQLIIGRIKEVFPDHGILSEEEGFSKSSSPFMWIIDPIDGTINYYKRTPPFRVGICLLKHRQPVLSAIFNPTNNNLFFAE